MPKSEPGPRSLSASVLASLKLNVQRYIDSKENPPNKLMDFVDYLNRGPKGRGRPKGSGMIDDEAELARAESLIASGVVNKPGPAIEKILDESDPDNVARDSIARRLRRKLKSRTPD